MKVLILETNERRTVYRGLNNLYIAWVMLEIWGYQVSFFFVFMDGHSLMASTPSSHCTSIVRAWSLTRCIYPISSVIRSGRMVIALLLLASLMYSCFLSLCWYYCHNLTNTYCSTLAAKRHMPGGTAMILLYPSEGAQWCNRHQRLGSGWRCRSIVWGFESNMKCDIDPGGQFRLWMDGWCSLGLVLVFEWFVSLGTNISNKHKELG